MFLIKPYWQYGKSYIIISLLISVFIVPITPLITVLLTQTIIDTITIGATFNDILMIIIRFITILIGSGIIQSIFNIYGEPVVVKIYQKMNKDIYEKALKTDYKYYDDPEFYNNYTWAINEFTSKSEEAKNLFINVFQSISITITMLTVILVSGPWIVAMTLVMLVLTTTTAI